MKNSALPLLLSLALLSSCEKEPNVVYEVTDVNVGRDGANKQYVKSQTEFISIAYADLFGTNISQQELLAFGSAYAGFGDLKLIEDLIIRSFLKRPDLDIPTNTQMRANVDGFVAASYQKFFNREPNEFELWYMANLINSEPQLTPEMFYYGLMTSNEYRYY